MGSDRENEHERHHRDDRKSHKRHTEKEKKNRSSRRSRDDVLNPDESYTQRDDKRQSKRSDDLVDRQRRQSKQRHRDVDGDDVSYDRDRNRKQSKSQHRQRDERDKKRSKKKKHRRGDDRSCDSSDQSRRKKKRKKSDHSNESSKEKISSINQNLTIPSTLKVDKSKLYPIGNVFGKVPDKILEVEKDYFEFHQHFWLYLYRDRQIAFNDLSADQARYLFDDFVKQYNEGKLESGYYNSNGPPPQALNEIKTSGHKWGFQISDRESKNLETLQAGIRIQTEYSNTSGVTTTNAASAVPLSKPLDKNKQDEDKIDDTMKSRTNKSYKNYSRREEKEHIDNIDDMMGRKEGRERLIEKRKEVGAKIHGAATDREDSTFASIIPDDVIYGDTESDFQSAIASQKQRKLKHAEQQQARMAELKSKEEEKQKAMIEMLGLSDKIKLGTKIQIQPRND
jgi:hypothetical protein